MNVKDTTERHRADDEIRAEMRGANQQLLLAALREEERAETLFLADRAKDEFLAMLAHELRNPLAAIRTGVYLLGQRAAGTDAASKDTCELIERQLRHLSRLLDDLLDVSRITQGKIDLHRKPVDLVRAVERVSEACQLMAEPGRHEVTLALPAEPVRVDADPVRLDQILTNLIHNAMKYTPAGGRIDVCVAVEESGCVGVEEPDTPTHPHTHTPAHAVISVRDTGVGIGPEALTQIFDLFVQSDASLDRAQGGLGIGLTLVRRLTELHGGSVTAHSAGPGTGSEFVVRLPMRSASDELRVSNAPPTEAGALTRYSTLETRNSRRVLLVEDNVDAAETLTEVLELWGYEVQVVHTGQAALAAASPAASPVPPYIILLDIGLPDMDGYELARRLRAEPALDHTPLVALTGYSRQTDRERSREAGFDFHLAKPIDLEELRRTIAAEGGRHAP